MIRSACATTRILSAFLLLGFLAGCGGGGSPQPAALPWQGQQVKVAVVGDQQMEKAVQRIQGEWEARTGAKVEVVAWEVSEEPGKMAWDAAKFNGMKADVILYPSPWLPDLAEAKHLLPLSDAWRTQPKLHWEERFELLRRREATWGESKVLAVPLGSPVLMLFYRADWFREAGLKPPSTWAEYQQAAQHFQAQGGTAEPLGEGWLAVTFLARAASYAKHHNHYADLFDLDTMEPLIAGPPFVRALQELQAAYATGTPDQLGYTPHQARLYLEAGRAAMALTWPDRQSAPVQEVPPGFELGVAELPGSLQSYNLTLAAWEDRAAVEHVPLLGFSGCLGSVNQNTPYPAAAEELLASLAGEEWGASVSQSNPSTLPPLRNTNWRSGWLPTGPCSTAADSLSSTLRSTLSRPHRLPGHSRYLSTLDASLRSCLTGHLTPEASLSQTATSWRTITSELGTSAQRTAYQRSLGILP